jgi:hypothetical protein
VGVIRIGISRLFISIPPHPMHHIGCMAVLNLTWFGAAPLPRGEREFSDESFLVIPAEAGIQCFQSTMDSRPRLSPGQVSRE